MVCWLALTNSLICQVLVCIGRYLKLAMCRYVDDYFAAERYEASHRAAVFAAAIASVHMFVHTFARPELREHSLECFARLVRLLLGPDAIAENKLEHGVSLVVLGIKIKLSKKGMKCRPAGSKTTKWLQTIDAALESGKLCAGSASKLAGADICDNCLSAVRFFMLRVCRTAFLGVFLYLQAPWSGNAEANL